MEIEVLFLALVAVAADAAPDAGSAGSSDERANDEYPEVCESLTTLEYGGSDGTGGVHACAGVVDANEVDEDQ